MHYTLYNIQRYSTFSGMRKEARELSTAEGTAVSAANEFKGIMWIPDKPKV